MSPAVNAPDLARLAERSYEGEPLAEVGEAVRAFRLSATKQNLMLRALRDLDARLGDLEGTTLQERWRCFEAQVWPRWQAGEDRPPLGEHWAWGAAALVLSRAVRPDWPFFRRVRSAQWIPWLPEDDPMPAERARLGLALAEGAGWAGEQTREAGRALGTQMLWIRGYRALEQVAEADLAAVPYERGAGLDALDAALCHLGVFDRTPRKGTSRKRRGGRLSPEQMAVRSQVPERFRAVHALYLRTYGERISDVYSTRNRKSGSLAHFWRFLDTCHPELRSPAEVRRAHVLAFIEHARGLAERHQRRRVEGEDGRMTAYAWILDVRGFFADVCGWATEEGSPFVGMAPPAVPVERFELRNMGFEQGRRRQAKRMTATVLDLEREMPKVRAHLARGWQAAEEALAAEPESERARRDERDRFWDWALLELLVQSGLRIEEACELTTLDVLRRRHRDGRAYYMLHIKPSKYDRARVIPIGDGLGRVIAEIIRHVKGFYGTEEVPACDRWDRHEKRDQARAPYLLQGARHPSALAESSVRDRLARCGREAGARHSDGTPLAIRPHDCRRIFASEHLNNDTPIHVIQALLGHASPDTVMVYAKIYPTRLVEAYRKTVRATYTDFHGPEALRAPTLEEWRTFEQSCELRDMGTHLCALPTGEHCPKGLVCLGCSHAQPKKSAAPVFRRMLQSHSRALETASANGEPAGQIAARELEVTRIRGALDRAEQLSDDVATAIEAAAA